ncbi:hypothetical protein ACJIZ3_000309 [Penstemon smallii]|uniref:SWIM-type domain-containing protein n=1 Tax=Penstemon smallii TaxID=265156 RepID=A0ABD3RCQ7_9LAMI
MPSKVNDEGCCKHENEVNEQCEEELGDFVNPCINEELIGQVIFDSIDEAEIFYVAYAKAQGFDVRGRSIQKKGEVVKNRVWVCTREGFRGKKEEGQNMLREAKPLTRCGCKASLRVIRDLNSGKYIVSRFSNNHNHELHGYMKRRKTGYNWLNKLRAERIQEGDMNTVINDLEELKLKNARLFYKYNSDEDVTLTRLFWCDGCSRAEYEAFGDVMVFDRTYKTNKYSYPLVIFSGVNNHGSTCIFGACFLQNETIESYQWVLQAILEAMGGKIPEVVLTDQDAAMRSAIISEFIGTRHRICSWHLCRNVRKNIKNSAFCNDFCSLMDLNCSVEEFELTWSNMVEKHNLSNNKWVVDTYEIRERWAGAYFREQFMSMMTTTQRAESVNALIKLSKNHNMSITDFLDHYFRTLQRLRSDFIEMQKLSEQDEREVRESPLKRLEEQALSIYTLKIYFLIRKEIRNEQGVVEESRNKDRDGNEKFVYRENNETEVSIHRVVVHECLSKFQCDCFKLESEGIPCRHIISTLKYYAIKKFPEYMIKRKCQEKRFGELNKECLNMSFVSSQSEKGYSNSIKRVREVAEMANDEIMKQSQYGSVPSENKVKVEIDSSNEGLQDPVIEKTTTFHDRCRKKSRGVTGEKKQKCGTVLGHKSTTCELNNPSIDDGEKKKKTNATRSPKERSTRVDNSTEDPEIPSQESTHPDSHINNTHHLGSCGPLPQFSVIFNMQQNCPIVLNMQPNSSLLPFSYPMVPRAGGMGSLGVQNVMRPNTTLLWQQQTGAPPGSIHYPFQTSQSEQTPTFR